MERFGDTKEEREDTQRIEAERVLASRRAYTAKAGQWSDYARSPEGRAEFALEAERTLAEWILHGIEADTQFCFPNGKIEVVAAISRVLAERDTEMRGLRRWIHRLEKHNQHFERCESGWCNPSDDCNPAKEVGIPEIWPADRVVPVAERDAKLEKLLAALRIADDFISDELNCRKASFLPDPTGPEADQIADAEAALKTVQDAIAKGSK